MGSVAARDASASSATISTGPSTLTYWYGSSSCCAHSDARPAAAARRPLIDDAVGQHLDVAAGLVRVPDGHDERRAVGSFDPQHADVQSSQEVLAL